ncbi:MAG: hypothetical protein HOP09_17525, partial [Hyphomicrobium sp.]|nr:hypothetical protein [Hyphomicrobium sp.]
TATHFVAINTFDDLTIDVTGSGFTYDAMGDILSGSANSLVIYVAAVPVANLTYSPAISIVSLQDGLDQYRSSGFTNTTLLDALFSAVPTTTTGNTGPDSLYGWDNTDYINGGDGADTLFGGGGNDTLNGGTGIDAMTGGDGNDIYVVDSASDTTTETNANINTGGIDLVMSSVTRTLGTNLENLTLTGTLAINGTGNAFNNVLTGNAAANVLTGGAGADTMTGGGGNDIILVDNAWDQALEAVGQGTNDYVYATNSFALAAGQEIEGLSANPQAGTNPINLTGNEFRQIIRGNNGTNTLLGGGGNDSLYGYAGNDTIESQAGNDSLFGGTGVDRFQFRQSQLGAASGIDRIYDFTAADYIKIDTASVLSERALLSTEFAAGTTALDASDRVIYDQVSGAVWFDADGTGAQAKILFAVLDTKPVIAASEFLLF